MRPPGVWVSDLSPRPRFGRRRRAARVAPLAVGSVGGAVMLFQRTLGILVETPPGMFGFLHLTLAEYFAAREFVRAGGLEEIVADPARVFRP